MSDFGNHKWVKTRKEHSCVYCGRTIPVGTKSLNFRGRWEDSWQNWYACGFCEVNISPDCSEGINGDEFNDWLYESKHIVCEKCKTRYDNEWEWGDGYTSIRVYCPGCRDEWVVAIPFEVEVDQCVK